MALIILDIWSGEETESVEKTPREEASEIVYRAPNVLPEPELQIVPVERERLNRTPFRY